MVLTDAHLNQIPYCGHVQQGSGIKHMPVGKIIGQCMKIAVQESRDYLPLEDTVYKGNQPSHLGFMKPTQKAILQEIYVKDPVPAVTQKSKSKLYREDVTAEEGASRGPWQQYAQVCAG